MCQKTITIQNAEGLHGRSATYFIAKANTFNSKIRIEYGNKSANAKSMLGVLSLAVHKGCTISIIATGDDEEAAVESLASMLLSISFQ